ncbi:hypothetical protein SPRG_03980 [Saprolegnia parasitica CBS 223.65]|uniref:Uncharacterized protein n=1 Tax=Saprolegnia parasitica (strain CBS 223.65) TaxID=695850 RepID=A0A067CLH5_SAPPC|nr:hypothetical protein SPRG_03980 [Saprolegnia parasitica CBS 223.65]KDO31363.1 hypothetical protein SPRG_03980 [Saprolegnia parasitica CBS 223.65]|eukprot:XP_012197960.1 hypothetical protein SPRG_03980 [Saprolegnia parasitica CBS 223.65]
MSAMSKPLVLGAIAASVVALFFLFKAQSNNSESSNASKEEAGERSIAAPVAPSASLPSLPKDQLLSILTIISTQMGQIVLSLANIEQKIRQESAQSGRSLPEDQLAAYLMGQFEEAMKAIEAQAYSKHNTSEDEVRIATEYYESVEDPEVHAAVGKLQELYRLITGAGAADVEVPEDLTLEKFLIIMEETMESLNVAMEEVCQEVKLLDPEDKEEAINERYVKKADQLSAQIHEQHGLSREILQAAMMKYQQEPIFLQRMTELQHIQSQRFAAAGSIFNGEVNMGLSEE